MPRVGVAVAEGCMVVHIILVGSVGLLPIVILIDSKRRLGTLSWEWAILVAWLMSLWAALAIDIIFPSFPGVFGKRTFISAWLRVALAGLVPYIAWNIYRATEVARREAHDKPRKVRAAAAALLGIQFLIGAVGYIVPALNTFSQSLINLGLAVAGLVAFVGSQVAISSRSSSAHDGPPSNSTRTIEEAVSSDTNSRASGDEIVAQDTKSKADIEHVNALKTANLSRTKTLLESKIQSARRGGLITTGISAIIIVASLLKADNPEVIIMISTPFLLFGLYLLYQAYSAGMLLEKSTVNRESQDVDHL